MGKLFVVGTPIGNLGDISARALETLRSADFIAAEDTRVTLKLLSRFDIRTRLVAYHEHSTVAEETAIADSVRTSAVGAALVTDAGMPGVSDPGRRLIDRCLREGIEVVSVPGASALTAAVSIAGTDAQRFCFEGFLSVNNRSRREHLESLKNERRLMIFYEAPHKLLRTLKDFLQTFGDRQIVIARELTKIHEEILRFSLQKAVEHYENIAPKGEFVILVTGCPEEACERADGLELAAEYAAGGLSKSEAAKRAAKESGMSRSEIYRWLSEKN